MWFQETITWPGTLTGGSSTTFAIFQDPGVTEMEILTSAKVAVYVLNQTEMTKGVNSSWDMSKLKPKVSTELNTWINVTHIIESNLTYQHFQNDWGIENFSTTSSTYHGTVYNLIFYIVIVNENSNYTEYSFRWQTPNSTLDTLGTVFSSVVYMVLIAVGFVLLIRSRKEQKQPDRKVIAHVYRNFAYGLIAGGIATFVWQLWGWLWASYPILNWINALSFSLIPPWVLGGVLSQNILTFMTLVCLGASIAFMSNSIEKDIQNRKVPFLTYIMLIAEMLIITLAIVIVYVPLLTVAFGIIIYAWVGSMLLIAANIIITYIKVIVQSTGMLRKKTLIVMISVLLIFVGLIVRGFIRPDFIANAIAACSTLVFYKGITMD
ncbi:MAG TPA: hypothetical protein VKM55_16810 [Candidatus Lokiarchaeia archaeon]|nr:hypothetical protein [Candidatus Lokiarchaeia archaeon]